MNVLYFIEDYQPGISSLSSQIYQVSSSSAHMLYSAPLPPVSVEEIALPLRQLLHCPHKFLWPFHLLRDLSLESIPFFLVLTRTSNNSKGQTLSTQKCWLSKLAFRLSPSLFFVVIRGASSLVGKNNGIKEHDQVKNTMAKQYKIYCTLGV